MIVKTKKSSKSFALITSAASDPGYHLARQFASDQCNLVLVDNNPDVLNRQARHLKKYFNIDVIPMVKETAVVSAAVETYNDVCEKGLHIDYLVNIAQPANEACFLATHPETDVDFLQQNIISFVSFTKYFLRSMIKRNKGTVYHVLPGATKMGSLTPAISDFIVSLTASLTAEIAHTNINMMCLSPGDVYTSDITVAQGGLHRGTTRIPATFFHA